MLTGTPFSRNFPKIFAKNPEDSAKKLEISRSCHGNALPPRERVPVVPVGLVDQVDPVDSVDSVDSLEISKSRNLEFSKNQITVPAQTTVPANSPSREKSAKIPP